MKKILMGITIVLALFATILLAGVVKTKFVSGGLFITGGSKITGNGNQFTQCDYFDALTGAFLGDFQAPGVGFDNETDLAAFCEANAPK